LAPLRNATYQHILQLAWDSAKYCEPPWQYDAQDL